MSLQDVEHDTLPGGQTLPSALSMSKFVACRSQEIQIMKNSLITQSGTKLAFQTLPKHMRRRAMSHNMKRLPRRLRQIHLNQMKKSGMPTKQKRPSRKYRRRPRNLVQEYTKRSSKSYKWLQTHIWHAKRFHMVEKWGYKLPERPCDKAFRACYRAVAQHCLLQDVSYLNCLEIKGERSLIVGKFKEVKNGGLSVEAKAFISGSREGELTLYDLQHRMIGNVSFQWQPNQNETSKLWLWVHSAFYGTLKETLSVCFNGLPVILKELGTELSRFRLTGPLSNSVLHDTFMMANTDDLSNSHLKKYTTSQNIQTIKSQFEYWGKIKDSSTSSMSPHSVLGLIVDDPRFNLPKKRKKSVPESFNPTFHEMPISAAESPLWDEAFRSEVSDKISDAEVAKLRGQLLIPGSDINQTRAHIPIILIQRPGKKRDNIGLGSGWDVVVPSLWAKTFWVAMVMRGARAGGLRETNSILFEMGKNQFLEPDSEAGFCEDLQVSQENMQRFFKKPPNKRTNYNKLKIVSPFLCNWDLLTKEWNGGTNEKFFVLRDKKVLFSIETFIGSKRGPLPEYPKNCLIPVKLECLKRGCPSQYAIICLPKFRSDITDGAMEATCEDKFQAERKEMRRTHCSLLKKLRKQRKTKKNYDPEEHKAILANYTKKMRELWLPQATTIRNSCSREVIGFVTKGGFSFAQGKSCATGYITSDCFPALEEFRDKILVRNTNSRQYKVAKISVISE